MLLSNKVVLYDMGQTQHFLGIVYTQYYVLSGKEKMQTGATGQNVLLNVPQLANKGRGIKTHM